MSLSVFNRSDCDHLISRINQLTPNTKGLWGKMSVDQMLAHVNVSYDITFDLDRPVPGFFKSLMLNLFVKNIVVGPKPYKRNNPTAAEFVITGSRDFEKEKQKLVDHINRVEQEGESAFDNRLYANFGKLTLEEWNNLFLKHLNHHLTQFGV